MKRNILAAIAYSTLGIITLIFSWKEHWSLSSQINHEKIASLFTVIGSIGTIVGLYFIYKQIELSAEMREDAVLPEFAPLPVEEIMVTVSKSMSNNFPGPPTLHSVSVGFGNSVLDDSVLVKFSNIGVGIAYHIRMRWKYDVEGVNTFAAGNLPDQPEPFIYWVDVTDVVKVDGLIGMWLPKHYLRCLAVSPHIPGDPHYRYPALELELEYRTMLQTVKTIRFAVKLQTCWEGNRNVLSVKINRLLNRTTIRPN